MTFSDFIGLNNNMIIGSNCCGWSGWIFVLVPVVKPDLDYACTQLVKFKEFFVKELLKDIENAFSSKAKKSQLVDLFNAATLIPLVDLAA